MTQLSLAAMVRSKQGSFGAQRHAWARRRIMAGELHRLPRTWRISGWVIQRLIATPTWADFKEIRKIYDRAAQLTWETGIEHVVDHDIPLRHPHVCGLHVQFNLIILTKEANASKSNKWNPHQLELF